MATSSSCTSGCFLGLINATKLQLQSQVPCCSYVFTLACSLATGFLPSLVDSDGVTLFCCTSEVTTLRRYTNLFIIIIIIIIIF